MPNRTTLDSIHRDWVVILSFKVNNYRINHRDVEDVPVDSIRGITLGYKKTLSSVFHRYVKHRIYKQYFEVEGTLLKATAIRLAIISGRVKSSRVNHDIVTVMHVKAPVRIDLAEIVRDRLLKGATEQEFIGQLVDSMGAPALVELWKSCRNYAGIKIHQIDGSVPADTTYAIHAFYYYAWLTITRLDRYQLDVDVMDEHRSLREISDSRLHLINLNRYFLTTNRSLNPPVKQLCVRLIDGYNLKSRYQRLDNIVSSFENHLANISYVLEAKRSANMRRAVRVVTFMVVPLGIFSALMATKMEVPVIAAPDSVMADYRFWMIVAVSLAIPVIIVLLGSLLDVVLSLVRGYRA